MTEIVFAVVLIWLTGDTSQPPYVSSVQYETREACEENKARAMAVVVAVQKANGYDENAMRGVVVCSHLKSALLPPEQR